MIWNKQRLLMINLKLLRAWLVLSVTLALLSCSKPAGPAITGCLVDTARNGFDCVIYPHTRYYTNYKTGMNLECASPSDVETFLKACKNGKVATITLCQLDAGLSYFHCKDPNGVLFQLALNGADNYFCMNEQDRQRIIQRCNVPRQF